MSLDDPDFRSDLFRAQQQIVELLERLEQAAGEIARLLDRRREPGGLGSVLDRRNPEKG